jgi:hypothetical protein
MGEDLQVTKKDKGIVVRKGEDSSLVLPDPRDEAIAQWLATPKRERKERRQSDFAAIQGVTSRWLRELSARPDILERCRFLVSTNQEKAKLAVQREMVGIVEKQIEKALGGDNGSATFCKDLIEDKVNGVAVQVNQTITLEQALKETEEAWPLPTWATVPVLPSEVIEVSDITEIKEEVSSNE